MAKKKTRDLSLVDSQKIYEAFDFIDKNGVPDKNEAREVVVIYNNKEYPTKYTLAVAWFLQFNDKIDTNDFVTGDAIEVLIQNNFMLSYKSYYQLTITKDSVVSTDTNFSMDDLSLGNNCVVHMAYFVDSSGKAIYRKRDISEKKVSNQTMPRIAFQIYEKSIVGLSKKERLDFPTCQYKPHEQMIKGIYESKAEMAEHYNAFNSMHYKTSDGKQFFIYCWNVFTTIIFVKECLKRFGAQGDKFILFYCYKQGKNNVGNKIIENSMSVQEITDNKPPKDKWQEFKNDYPLKENYPLNQILYGPPGTGKTYNSVIYSVAICKGIDPTKLMENVGEGKQFKYKEIVDEYKKFKNSKHIEFVTFHQSYGYEEFIQGIKPSTNDKGQIEYKVESGIFKKFCEEAKDKSEEKFVFIIDEINRGNVSKIFGELITLIEESKRLGKDEEMKARLPYKDNDDKDVYFGVPNNVYILGTMNTADRSLVQLDAALRRRFRFIEMMPEAEVLNNKTDIDKVNLKQLLNAVNERITVLIDREHQIGHSYFTKVNSVQDLKETFENEIIPLLQEYFYEDYEGIKIVLGKKFIKDEEKTIGGITKKIYTIEVTDKPEDFTAIYKTKENPTENSSQVENTNE